jgi:4-hydroxybenzoate polyprenyltransferase
MLIEFLKLIRLPLLFTAVADPVAGYCLGLPAGTAPQWEQLRVLVPAGIASACLYAAGMVFNDCTDMIRDRTIHPDRPLAAGRVAFPAAFGLGAGLLAAALLAAQLTGPRTSWVALLLGLGVLLYDAVTKRDRLLGALTMGALRGGNVLMGYAAALPAGASFGGRALVFPAGVFAYVALLTALSHLEEPPARPRLFTGLVVAMAAAMVIPVCLLPGDRMGLLGIVLVFMLAGVFLFKGLSASREFDPGQVPDLVKTAVVGIIPLDAAAALVVGQWAWAMAILFLLVPSLLLLTGYLRVPGLERAT